MKKILNLTILLSALTISACAADTSGTTDKVYRQNTDSKITNTNSSLGDTSSPIAGNLISSNINLFSSSETEKAVKVDVVEEQEIVSNNVPIQNITVKHDKIIDLRNSQQKVNNENEKLSDAVLSGSNVNNVAFTPVNNQSIVTKSNTLPDASGLEAGQCMGKVKIFGEYKTIQEDVVVKEASTKTISTPAKYKEVEEVITIKEASSKVIEIRATYKTIQETITVSGASQEEIIIPATYKTIQEKILVKPARKVWKQGRGLVEKTNSDGDIMCLVEEPAEYKTISKQILATPERVEYKTIPAVTKTVNKQIVASPAQAKTQAIPAVTKKIKKLVLVEDAKTQTVQIPAVTEKKSRRVQVKPDEYKWMNVLCEDNITPAITKKIQGALAAKGYGIEKVDGNFGPETRRVVSRYQEGLGYQSSGVVLNTLKSLNLSF